MNIQCCTPFFTGRTQKITQSPVRKNQSLKSTGKDTFERTTFDVTKDLNKIELREFINEGRTRKVYKTNFDGIVAGLIHGGTLRKDTLKAFDDPTGLIIAKNDYDTIRIMRHIKGTPLYGYGWNVGKAVSKDKYMETFHKITALPDESFVEYIKNFIKIKENGYTIDTINPNNFLLYKNHIGMVDLDKMEKFDSAKPYKLEFKDFDALVNRHDIKQVLEEMSPTEIDTYSNEIKAFYDRIIKIAKKLGQEIQVPKIERCMPGREKTIYYLYYKDWEMLGRLVKSAHIH